MLGPSVDDKYNNWYDIIDAKVSKTIVFTGTHLISNASVTWFNMSVVRIEPTRTSWEALVWSRISYPRT